MRLMAQEPEGVSSLLSITPTTREGLMSRLAAAIAILLYATTAHADVIVDWNQNALEVLKAANVAGNPWSRAMAMVHVAMCDAVNSVQPRYTRFVSTAPAAPNVSAEAAAASAAR